ACFPLRVLRRCWRCRSSYRARGRHGAPTSHRGSSCRRSAPSSRATSWRSRCSAWAFSCGPEAVAPNRIDSLRAPLLVSWQLTRDCDLACLHCCTESAPGKRLADELDPEEALRIAGEIVRDEVPYVMLCGGEPLVVPHFLAIAETLGTAGIKLKIETNGQRLDDEAAGRLARLPVRSIQVSLDGDTQQVYERQRPGGSLAKAHAACRAVRAAGLPLEITFAPTRLNLHEAAAVIRRARELGAFRFNSGQLMRVGTAARHWQRLAPPDEAWSDLRARFAREAAVGG